MSRLTKSRQQRLDQQMAALRPLQPLPRPRRAAQFSGDERRVPIRGEVLVLTGIGRYGELVWEFRSVFDWNGWVLSLSRVNGLNEGDLP